MSIVNSVAIVDSYTQPDGSRYVVERHTDSVGIEYTLTYMAPAGYDTAARLATNAAALSVRIAEQEADEVIQ